MTKGDRRHGQFECLPGPTMSEGVETFVKDLAKQNGQSVEEAARWSSTTAGVAASSAIASVEAIANMVVDVSSQEPPQ